MDTTSTSPAPKDFGLTTIPTDLAVHSKPVNPKTVERIAAAIARAEGFEMEAVTLRLMKDVNVGHDQAKRLMFELRRFLVVCSLRQGGSYGMRGPVDDAWHTFLMFTREYARFCETVAGRFIHHVPDTGADNREHSAQGYAEFLEAYELTFGEQAPSDLWPRATNSRSECSENGCGGCSGCGTDQVANAAGSDGCEGCNGCQTDSSGCSEQ